MLNPGRRCRCRVDLELVVAGTDDAVLMVESEASGLSEEVMLGAVMFGHEQMQVAIDAISELAAEVGKPAWDWEAPPTDEDLAAAVADAATADCPMPTASRTSMSARQLLVLPRAAAVEALAGGDDARWSAEEVKGALSKLEKSIVRNASLQGEPRIDGRDTSTVRPIDVEVGVLPRAHGSAVFTRGETQAIVVTTLGTGRDAQIIDAIEGERKEPFMLHYNFPPFCVGETGFVGSPKRREIGHGKLARRGIAGGNA